MDIHYNTDEHQYSKTSNQQQMKRRNDQVIHCVGNIHINVINVNNNNRHVQRRQQQKGKNVQE
jgi:hypothetical protein